MNNSGLNPRALENPPISDVICDGDRRWLLGEGGGLSMYICIYHDDRPTLLIGGCCKYIRVYHNHGPLLEYE